MASKKMIKIISISKDRQSCIDVNGNVYNVFDIENMLKNGENISVIIAYNKSKNYKYIKYKKNCKENIFENFRKVCL